MKTIVKYFPYINLIIVATYLASYWIELSPSIAAYGVSFFEYFDSVEYWILFLLLSQVVILFKTCKRFVATPELFQKRDWILLILIWIVSLLDQSANMSIYIKDHSMDYSMIPSFPGFLTICILYVMYKLKTPPKTKMQIQ